MNIIVTAFNNNKLHDDAYHAGKNILRNLPSTSNGVEIRKVILPLVFNHCFEILKPSITKDTIGIISLGSVGGNHFAIERICVNLMNSNGPDNSGYTANDETIKPNGRNAYFTNLHIRNMEQKLLENNIPTIISNSAGLALCNNIFYHVAYYAEHEHLNYQYGFIHLPEMEHEKNINRGTLPLNDLLTGTSIIIQDIIQNTTTKT